MKEIKARPLDENNKEGKMSAYMFFFQPFLTLAMANVRNGWKKNIYADIFPSLLFSSNGRALISFILNTSYFIEKLDFPNINYL